MPYDTLTFRFKAAFVAMISIMTLIIGVGAFSIQDDPRFKTQAIAAYLRHLNYATVFNAANALGAANTISGLEDEEESHAPIRSVPVLVFHGIIKKPDGSSINHTEAQFKDHLFALRRAGYETITLEELYAFGTKGDPLPPKPLLITFDDGRADSFYNGDPIIDAVNYTAVMFPIAKYVRESKPGGYYLAPEEITWMAKSGRWEIGSHSDQGHEQYQVSENEVMGNFFSNYLWREAEGRVETKEEFRTRIAQDFEYSRRYLEEVIESPIASFAFPFGDLGQNQKDAQEKTSEIVSGASQFYRLLFYQYRPGEYFTQMTEKQRRDGDTLLVRRIDVDSAWSTEHLLDYLAQGAAKTLPYEDTFDTDRGWINIWGTERIENGTLTLAAEELKTGASTILDGTQNWTDYQVRAEVVSPQRTGVFLWLRFQNDEHNAGCNFGTEFVHVEQTIGGERRVIKGVNYPQGIPEGPFSVSARVEGRTIVCSINDQEIVRSEFLDPSLTHGGIGLKIWDEALGKSSLEVTKLVVEEIKAAE